MVHFDQESKNEWDATVAGGQKLLRSLVWSKASG